MAEWVWCLSQKIKLDPWNPHQGGRGEGVSQSTSLGMLLTPDNNKHLESISKLNILTLIALIAALVIRIILALEMGGFMSISEKSLKNKK